MQLKCKHIIQSQQMLFDAIKPVSINFCCITPYAIRKFIHSTLLQISKFALKGWMGTKLNRAGTEGRYAEKASPVAGYR